MTKIFGMMLLLIGASVLAVAGHVPEIDPGLGGTALALLSGALLIIRERRKR